MPTPTDNLKAQITLNNGYIGAQEFAPPCIKV